MTNGKLLKRRDATDIRSVFYCELIGDLVSDWTVNDVFAPSKPFKKLGGMFFCLLKGGCRFAHKRWRARDVRLLEG